VRVDDVDTEHASRFEELGEPRGDGVFKAWVDQWLHLAKATGEYDRTTSTWLK
jgi:hypothetical protein